MNCPQCLRPKANSADDVVKGFCPKWWAVRDNEAYVDCDKATEKRLSHAASNGQS